MFLIFTCWALSGNDYHQHSSLEAWLNAELVSPTQRPKGHRFSGDDNAGFISLQWTKISSCKDTCFEFLLYSKLLAKTVSLQSVIQPSFWPFREPNVHTNSAIPHMQVIGFAPKVCQLFGRKLHPHFPWVHALPACSYLDSIFTALTSTHSLILVIRFC